LLVVVLTTQVYTFILFCASLAVAAEPSEQAAACPCVQITPASGSCGTASINRSIPVFTAIVQIVSTFVRGTVYSLSLCDLDQSRFPILSAHWPKTGSIS
jgi:hypothetical protein